MQRLLNNVKAGSPDKGFRTYQIISSVILVQFSDKTRKRVSKVVPLCISHNVLIVIIIIMFIRLSAKTCTTLAA
jgi:type IV secretory pathway VirB6-like protein